MSILRLGSSGVALTQLGCHSAGKGPTFQARGPEVDIPEPIFFKKLGGIVCTCSPHQHWKGRDSQIPGARWLAVCLVSSRSVRDPAMK